MLSCPFDDCDFKSAKKQGLAIHIAKKHPKTYKCKDCLLFFNTEDILAKHMRQSCKNAMTPRDYSRFPHIKNVPEGQENNNYITPKYAWEMLLPYLDKNKVYWEAFYCDGSSGKDLTDLGLNVIHENEDFFENNKGEIVLSNPPFNKTILERILRRLVALDKPFVLLLPHTKLGTLFMSSIFKDLEDPLQLLIPSRAIEFHYYIDGVKQPLQNRKSFHSSFFTWKMNFKRDLTFM